MTSSAVPARARPRDTASRIRLASWIWWTYVVVTVALRRGTLPDVVTRLSTGRRHPSLGSVARLSAATDRCLRLGRWEPRCLPRALVLLRLLRLQGEPAELVIGLPREPEDHRAHAWIELAGTDVGPPPGAHGHTALARFPSQVPSGRSRPDQARERTVRR